MINPPKDFTPGNPQNILVQMDKSFEAICSALVDMGVEKPKELNLLELHSRIDHFERKHKPRSKND